MWYDKFNDFKLPVKFKFLTCIGFVNSKVSVVQVTLVELVLANANSLEVSNPEIDGADKYSILTTPVKFLEPLTLYTLSETEWMQYKFPNICLYNVYTTIQNNILYW